MVELPITLSVMKPVESFLKVREETRDRTYNTNVKAIFLCSQRAASSMIERRKGKIINILSTAGLVVTSPVIPRHQSSQAAAHAGERPPVDGRADRESGAAG